MSTPPDATNAAADPAPPPAQTPHDAAAGGVIQHTPDGQTRIRGPWMLASMAVLVVAIFVGIVVPTGLSALRARRAPVDGYEVVAVYPHDTGAFTQGLAIDDGELFESTGLFGESTLRKVDLQTGRVLLQVDLPENVFGEGIAVLEDKIYMITWRNRIGYVFDRDTLTLLGQWKYKGEGWGLTTDGEWLIMSNGTEKITFYDPETLQPRKGTERKPTTIRVMENDARILRDLNELEYINNEIWANVYEQESIVRISPRNGKIRGFVDLSSLYPRRNRKQTVMNGIAFDRATQKIYITGKRWPKLYEIRVVEREAKQ